MRAALQTASSAAAAVGNMAAAVSPNITGAVPARSRSRERTAAGAAERFDMAADSGTDEEEFNPDNAMQQLFNQGAKTRKEMKLRLKGVAQDVTKMQEEVKAVSDRQDSMDKRVETLTNQVRELQAGQTSSRLSGAASSNGSTRASEAPTRTMRTSWNPSYVQISGWSKGGGNIRTRGSELMQDQEANAVITFLMAPVVAKDAQEHIDQELTSQENSHKPFGFARIRFVFKQGTGSKILWDFRSNILAAVASPEFKQITSKDVRASVEPSPWKRPHNGAAGCAYGIWQDLSSVPIKCELGPPFTYVWCYPDVNDQSQKFVIASFGDKSRQWKVDADQVKKADSSVDASIFQERLNAF